MYQAFYDLIYAQLFRDGYCLSDMAFTIGEFHIQGDEYFSCLIALICTIIVYSLCCLCIYKVIRLFGRLWSRF